MEVNAEQIRYKMSEKQIIRALECLSKPNSSPVDREKCYFMWKEPSCFSCYHEVAQNALSLIKQLTEENAELKRLRLCELVKANNLACDNALLQTVTAQRERTTVIPKSKIDDIYTSGMMDGVRQMQSKIKERCIKGGIYPAFVASTIEQIAKELIGDA